MPPKKPHWKDKSEEEKAECLAKIAERKQARKAAKIIVPQDPEEGEEEEEEQLQQAPKARKGAIKKRKHEESEDENEKEEEQLRDKSDDDDEDHSDEEEDVGELINACDMEDKAKMEALMFQLRKAQRQLKKQARYEEEREAEMQELQDKVNRRAMNSVKVDSKLIAMFTVPLKLGNVDTVMLYVQHHNHQAALVDGPKMDVQALITNNKIGREIQFYLNQYEDSENYKDWCPLMLCERLKSTLTGIGSKGKAVKSILECFEALEANPAEIAMIPAETMNVVHEIEEVMAKVSPEQQAKWTAEQKEQHVEALLKMFGNVDTNETARRLVHDLRKGGTPIDATALISRIEKVCQALQKAYGEVEPYLSAVMGIHGQQERHVKKAAQSGSVRDHEEDRRRMESELLAGECNVCGNFHKLPSKRYCKFIIEKPHNERTDRNMEFDTAFSRSTMGRKHFALGRTRLTMRDKLSEDGKSLVPTNNDIQSKSSSAAEATDHYRPNKGNGNDRNGGHRDGGDRSGGYRHGGGGYKHHGGGGR